MNRITFVSVLAFLAAVGSTGCLGQPAPSEEDTAATEQASRRAKYVGTSDEELYGAGQPNQQLELNVHPNGEAITDDEGQGPHPEPWQEKAGPHPEPWTGKTAEPSSGGNGGSGKDNKEP